MSIVKVFIADDSDTIRERLIELLAGISGVEIIGEAKDTSQAIASILKLNPEVVVLDIRMPGGSGIEVLKEIKKHVPAPIVIMLTNYPYSQYREKICEALLY